MFDLKADATSEKERKDKLERNFNEGIRISWILLFLSIVFTVFWAIAYSRRAGIIAHSNFFTNIFFFLNPNIFNVLFLEGNLISYLRGAVNETSFTFLIAYLVSLTTFLTIIGLSIRLFVISWNLGMKNFHYISIFSLFPIANTGLLLWFMGRRYIYASEMKKRGFSRFQQDWVPEQYEDYPLEGLNTNGSRSRPVTVAFTRKHYERLFGRKKGHIQKLHDWLLNQIS